MQQKIFFSHIPKTAGYTFHHILFRQFLDTKHAWIPAVGYTERYRRLTLRRKQATGVVRGHFVFGLHRDPGDEGICLTFLREPIARTISGYEYIYASKPHFFHKRMVEHQYTLYEFLDQKLIPNFDNMHVRYLCGDNSMPFGDINETHLELAWKNLMSDEVLFGLTEKFDESVVYFQQKLHAPDPFYERLNVSKNRRFNPAEMDEKTRQKLYEVNRYDLELYNRAKKVFEERINALGPDFSQRVSHFRELNKTFREPKYSFWQRINNLRRIQFLYKKLF